MRIQHNIAAMNSLRQLTGNNSAVSKSLEKLSSGYRINRAGDDAAGLAISEKMRAQIRGLSMASKNAQDGISLVQTAEGALTETHSILQRMRELAVQASNGIYADEDRQQTQLEIDALKTEVDRISTATTFNGIQLLDGSNSITPDYEKANEAANARVEELLLAKAAEIEEAKKQQTTASELKVGTTTATGNYVTGASAGKKASVEIKFTDAPAIGDKIKIGDEEFEFVETASADLSNGKIGVAATTTLTALMTNVKTAVENKLTGYTVTLNSAKDTITITAADEGPDDKLSALEYHHEGDNTPAVITPTLGEEAGAVLAPSNGKISYNMSLNKSEIADGSVIEIAGREYSIFKDEDTMEAAGKNTSNSIIVTAGNDPDATSEKLVEALATKLKQEGINASNDGKVLTIEAKTGVEVNGLFSELGVSDLTELKEVKFTNPIYEPIEAYERKDAIEDAEEEGYVYYETEADYRAALSRKYKDKPEDLPQFGVVFQIGANGKEDQRVEIEIKDMGSEALGIKDVNLTTQEGANAAITTIDEAINAVSAQRAQLGALQNRLEHTINNLDTNNENLTASESRIRDVDMAAEMMKYTQNNVLVQAAQSMLAQANQQPQSVLSLLQ